jgi:hypothetical protein
MVESDATLGQRNTVRCSGLEDKLAIHASPMCVMQFDNAVGELVGEEHGGIQAVFTMMTARLSIGLQGPSVAERSFQHAYRYAHQRQQGRAAGTAPPDRSLLVEHPDVRRMLLTMRTSSIAGRLLLYTVARYRDLANHASDHDMRESAHAYVDLLTPVAKAWSTDIGCGAASLGIQVLGGGGYVEESGMAQHFRDSRIGPIYEGTNGIQAIDLVMRKFPRDGGRWMRALLDDVSAIAGGTESDRNAQGGPYRTLADAAAVLETTTEEMLRRIGTRPEDVLAGTTSYLELLGVVLGGWLMIQRDEHARAVDSVIASRALMESEFFASEHLARAGGLVGPILAGASRLAGHD